VPLDAVTVGDSVVDIVIPVPRFPSVNEDTVEGEGMERRLGGASNFLIQASRLGLDVGLVDKVGDDELGGFFLEGLRGEGVDVSRVRVEEGERTAHCICMVDESGDHAYISFPGATSDLTPDMIDPDYIQGSRLLYLSGYALKRKPTADAVLKAVEVAQVSQVPVFFDPSPVISQVRREVVEAILESSDVLMLNRRELELLTSNPDVEEAVELLLGGGVKTIALKLGEDGCALYHSAGMEKIPGWRVKVVDTTGSGDSFNAALAYGYLEGWPMGEAARLANAVGAVKATKMGAGRGVPTREEIDAFLSKHGLAFEGFGTP